MKRAMLGSLVLSAFVSLGDVTLPNTSTIADIQAAIDDAEPGEVITLEDGTYVFDQTLTVANAVTLTGSHRDRCLMVGDGVTQLSAALILDHVDACVKNVTVSNIYVKGEWSDRGGVQILAGLFTQSRVTGCKTTDNSSKTAGVSLGNPTANNVAVMTHCIVDHNVATTPVGGVRIHGCGCTVANCLIWANTGIETGGISIAPEPWRPVKVVNCTIVGNTGGSLGGGLGLTTPYVSTFEGPWIVNTIISGNTASYGADIYFANDNAKNLTGYNCLCPSLKDAPYGANPQTGDPVFVSPETGDFRLQSGSSARNTGDKAKAASVLGADLEGTQDLYGLDRVMEDQVDIGCAEFDPYQVSCSIKKDKDTIFVGETLTLTADSSGFDGADDIVYSWSILREGEGEPFVTSGAEIVLKPTAFGTYAVNLTASSEKIKKSADAVPTTFLVAPKTVYVTAEENPDSAFPYAEPQTAATNLNEALEAAVAGATVMVGEGTNRVSKTVSIPRGVAVVGAGRDKTTIYAAVEFNTVVSMNDPEASLTGVTVAHGRMSVSFSSSAAGVDIGAEGGTLADCRVTDCGFKTGIFGGVGGVRLVGANAVVTRCLIDGNSTADSAGNATCGGILATAGRIENCVITNNVGSEYADYKASGVGLNGAVTMLNCTVLDNRMKSGMSGGGVHAVKATARVRNCIIDGNLNGDGSEANYLGNAASFSYCLSSDAEPEGSVGCVVGRPVFNAKKPLYLVNRTPGKGQGSAVGYEDRLLNATDFFGLPRVKNVRRGVANVDIGATESEYFPNGLVLFFM